MSLDNKKIDKRKTVIPLVHKEKIDYTLEEQATIENAVMFLPISENKQIHVYQYNVKDNRFIDIREYIKKKDKFVSTSHGVRIPLEMLEQLTIRLKSLLQKKNEWELKL